MAQTCMLTILSRVLILGWVMIVMMESCKGSGDFRSDPLDVGEVEHVIWRNDGEIADEYAVRIGLPPQLTNKIIEYCKEIGLWDMFWKFQYESPLVPGGSIFFEDQQGHAWQANRPESKWKSDMHWIQPSNEDTHEAFLDVLASGDFDTVLQSIGEFYPHLDSLSVHSTGFVSVSKCTRGFMHFDTTETDGKQFNLLFPIYMAKKSGPEFRIRDETDDHREGVYKYEQDVGVMVGDDTYHGTNACDYRQEKDIRVAVTIYLTDINDENAEIIASDNTSVFPPSDVDWTMAQKDRHWVRDNQQISMKRNLGRSPMKVSDRWGTENCQQLAMKGECENEDPHEVRYHCIKTCQILSSTRYPNDYIVDEEDEEEL